MEKIKTRPLAKPLQSPDQTSAVEESSSGEVSCTARPERPGLWPLPSAWGAETRSPPAQVAGPWATRGYTALGGEAERLLKNTAGPRMTSSVQCHFMIARVRKKPRFLAGPVSGEFAFAPHV